MKKWQGDWWMNIAIVPYDENGLKDRIFTETDLNHLSDKYKAFQTMVQQNGGEVHTIDCYPSLKQVDYFIFVNFNSLSIYWYRKVYKNKMYHRAIYFASEPECVIREHCVAGLQKMVPFFKAILTWNDDAVDGNRIQKMKIAHCTDVTSKEGKPFAERKLLTNISGDKSSDCKDELYSERRKVIRYYEAEHPNDFDLYGRGWSALEYQTYCGEPESKETVYQQYRFALCLENMKNVKGYITEKIVDCLRCGIVPIYGGASNIAEYVPDNCYLDYFAYSSLDEMHQALTRMTDEEWQAYIERGKNFMRSVGKEIFGYREYYQTIMNAIEDQTELRPPTFVQILYMKYYLGKCDLGQLKSYFKQKLAKKLINRDK